jgi:hypothetical protein
MSLPLNTGISRLPIKSTHFSGEPYLIGEVTHRLVFGIEGVRGYWRYSKRAFEHAQIRIVAEDVASLEQILRSPASQRYFTNREELLATGSYVQLFTRNSLEQQQTTLAGIAGSALVFAHAVFESSVYDALRIALLVRPEDWIPLVRQRTVRLSRIVDAPGSVVQSEVEEFCNELERAPLLKKVEKLYQIVSPGAAPSVVTGYRYAPDRLQALDEKRHRVTHQDRQSYSPEDLEEDLTFLFKTGFHLLALPVEKYNLRALQRPGRAS